MRPTTLSLLCVLLSQFMVRSTWISFRMEPCPCILSCLSYVKLVVSFYLKWLIWISRIYIDFFSENIIKNHFVLDKSRYFIYSDGSTQFLMKFLKSCVKMFFIKRIYNLVIGKCMAMLVQFEYHTVIYKWAFSMVFSYFKEMVLNWILIFWK